MSDLIHSINHNNIELNKIIYDRRYDQVELNTAMEDAIRLNNMEAVEKLLHREGNRIYSRVINAGIAKALAHRNPQMAKLLLHYGSPNAEFALGSALKYGYRDIVRQILQHRLIEVDKLQIILNHAAETGDVELAEMVLRNPRAQPSYKSNEALDLSINPEIDRLLVLDPRFRIDPKMGKRINSLSDEDLEPLLANPDVFKMALALDRQPVYDFGSYIFKIPRLTQESLYEYLEPYIQASPGTLKYRAFQQSLRNFF